VWHHGDEACPLLTPTSTWCCTLGGPANTSVSDVMSSSRSDYPTFEDSLVNRFGSTIEPRAGKWLSLRSYVIGARCTPVSLSLSKPFDRLQRLRTVLV